jgi:hypothetical protein
VLVGSCGVPVDLHFHPGGSSRSVQGCVRKVASAATPCAAVTIPSVTQGRGIGKPEQARAIVS